MFKLKHQNKGLVNARHVFHDGDIIVSIHNQRNGYRNRKKTDELSMFITFS